MSGRDCNGKRRTPTPRWGMVGRFPALLLAALLLSTIGAHGDETAPRKATPMGIFSVGDDRLEPVAGFRFLSPKVGQTVRPGEVLEYSLAHDGDTIPQQVVVEADFFAGMPPAKLSRAPFAGQWQVPADLFGRVEIQAEGRFGPVRDYPIRRASVFVHVLPAGPPSAIHMELGPQFTVQDGEGRPWQLKITGDYGQGRVWPQTDPGTGTVFESLDPNIATVSPTGWVKGHVQGRTLLAIRNAGWLEYVPVTVLDADGQPSPPDDVTQHLSVSIQVEHERPDLGLRIARVTARNQSPDPLWMPLWLILDGTLPPAHQITGNSVPEAVCSRLQYRYDVPRKAYLLPGDEIEASMTFAWPGPADVTIVPRVLAAEKLDRRCR